MALAIQGPRISYGAGLEKVCFRGEKNIKVRVSTRSVKEDGSETKGVHILSTNREAMRIIANSHTFGEADITKYGDSQTEIVVSKYPFLDALERELKPESPLGAIFYDTTKGKIDELNYAVKMLEENQIVNAPLLVYGNELQRSCATRIKRYDYLPYELFINVPQSALERHIGKLRENWKQNVRELNRYIKPSLTQLLTLNARDYYTLCHTLEGIAMLEGIAKELGASQLSIYKMYLAFLYHDTGKMEWSDSMLKKDGKFTDDEFVVMKGHPKESTKIATPSLEDIKWAIRRDILRYIKYHHRNYDANYRGGGYPDIEDAISGYDRNMWIVQLVDRLSAMSTSKKETHRSYREEEYDQSAILKDLAVNSGTQFDPDVAGAAIRYIKRGFSVEVEIPIPSGDIIENDMPLAA